MTDSTKFSNFTTKMVSQWNIILISIQCYFYAEMCPMGLLSCISGIQHFNKMRALLEIAFPYIA